MKILVVSNMYPSDKYPSYGTFVKTFCNQLSSLGIKYDISVMKKANSKPHKLINYFKFYSGTFFKCLFNNYDVVYVHYVSHSSLPVLAAKKIKKGINIFANVHGSDVVPENDKQEKMQKYTKETLEKSSRVIVPSNYFKEYVIKKYGLEDKKIKVYPSGGVNSQIFHPFTNLKKEELIKKLKLPLAPNLPTFGMVGRISFKKGWDTFLEAINIVEEEGIKANFLIVGDGPEKKKMVQMIKKLNLEDKIILMNSQSHQQLAYIYNLIDFFVFPTKREGESLGLVGIEALACGTPVIATDFAAPKYYIKNGYNGFKFSKENYKNLAKVIKNCANLTEKEYINLVHNSIIAAEPYMSKNIELKLKQIIEN